MATATQTLTINLKFEEADHGRPTPKLRVYLFDAADRLVGSQPAAPHVEFSLDSSARHRVTLGPDLIVNTDAPAPADLRGRLIAAGAISQDYIPQRGSLNLLIIAGGGQIGLWFPHCVNVHGSVRKLLNPGGAQPAYAPLCTGVVQIFTIDLAATLDNLSSADLVNLKNTMLARMFGVEIADILAGNFGAFANVVDLAAGMIPLTGAALKTYIVANRGGLASFMCNIIPEWDVVYQQYPDAQIQSDGTFSSEICGFLWQTFDLYFEVVQNLDGAATEVADPDILCSTMWNYDGSQAALITVNDPRAIACQPSPYPGPNGLYVWPTAIGNIDLGQIDGLETLAGTGLLPGDTPFGGVLPLQMQFSPDLQANGVAYYRWSYSFPGDAMYTQIRAPVTHRWQEITIGAGGVVVINLHAYALGPHLVGSQSNLFEIPDPNLDWIDIDDPVDRPFAYFNSTGGVTPFRGGLCKLKLEMFDASGNHLSCNNGGRAGLFQYLLPDLGAPVGTYTDAPPPNIDVNGDLIFQVLIDNNSTRAALYNASTGSHGSGDACGMRLYDGPNDPVTISYAATQAFNHIDWAMSVTEGIEGVVGAVGVSGNTSSTDPAFDTHNASVFLGSCVQAAFAVNLDCWARATNGYGRQSQYDSSATLAFALLFQP